MVLTCGSEFNVSSGIGSCVCGNGSGMSPKIAVMYVMTLLAIVRIVTSSVPCHRTKNVRCVTRVVNITVMPIFHAS